MKRSPSNSHSEPAKIEQIITEFFAKSLHIILESRSPYVSSRNYSGEQTASSPSSSSSSSSVRPRDKWFNLALRECPASLENLDLWHQSNLEPLVVDVILVRRPANSDLNLIGPMLKGGLSRNLSSNDQFLNSSNSGQEEFELRSEKVIERWVLQYESRKSSMRDLSIGSKKTGGTSSHLSDAPSVYRKTYKKSIILLRSLYVMVRLLPAYKLFRDLNSSGQLHPFSLAYKVASFVEPFTRREESEMQQFGFVPVDTYNGRLCLSVTYLPTISDVNSEPSTPLSPQFITDYVGSPTTDRLKRLPSIPLVGLMSRSPGTLSSVPFARRHSWSNDLHRASPSLSPSPSPTYLDSRAFPSSNPNPHCLPPRGHVNMNVSPSLNSPHHPPDTPCSSNVSLAHKNNMSFDECWSSPPFSPSPSPSPPTYLPNSHLSKALKRTESAPVSIPFARLGRSPGLLSNALPPSSSRRGMRPGCSSHSDNIRAQISLGAVYQSSPPGSKYQTRQDPLRSGEFQTGIKSQKELPFRKDEVGNLSGVKISSSSSPRISFSRSSSRLSFQDEFDDSEFVCPFAVDDDDITDPRNRAESFDGKEHVSEALEPGLLFPVRNSQDAAVGALVHILKTAPPLRQDCSNSTKFPHASTIQTDNNLDPGAGQLQNTASDLGLMSPSLLMSRTTANTAFEELRRYREIKDLLLNQAGSQSLDHQKI
ncbi:autophagy-related protein 13 [Tasmannia lanceolata]|uniref:autophagy-related protein 13 n=1 Tax=Tasmannia lanceolata TaxID=3420 RepID=UPI0040637BF3